MQNQRLRLTLCLTIILLTTDLRAQNGNNPGGGNQNGGNGQFPGGILINPKGMVEQTIIQPGSGADLQKQLKRAASQKLDASVNQRSELRKVSLKLLELEIENQLESATPLRDDIRHLAGLTRIDFVVITDDGQDIIIAGPAEGFASIRGGRMVGVETGRPVLCLDDLLVSLRSASEQPAVGCSIDPDPQRLNAATQWLKQNASPATADVARARLEQMVRLQGSWNISTFGVPEDSRMALAMIEADYLMKRMAIGIDHAGVKGMKSSLALAGPGDNMMRRWWFAPRYETLERNAAGTEWHLTGPRLQLFGQEDLMDGNGNLSQADFTQPSSEKFARQFNGRIEDLAHRVPAFADLQNIFDILIAAAIAHDAQAKGLVEWRPTVLLDGDQLPAMSYSVATETQPVLNARMAGASLVIGAFTGGVRFHPQRMLKQFTERTEPLEETHKLSAPPGGLKNVWWWD
jgi:hypothetical protein